MNVSTYRGEKNYKLIQFNEKITITRDDNKAYLIRNTLFRFGKWFSVKLHDIILSDDDCLHDHPWPFITFILRGGYYEWSVVKGSNRYSPSDYTGEPVRTFGAYLMIGKDGQLLKRVWCGPGSVLFRPASWAHRLELMDVPAWDGNGNPSDVLIPAKTLVFTFKVMRKWGFFATNGWVYWRDYNKKEHC